MTPAAKNRKPAPYKEKGQPKNRAVKFVVTEDEMQALEILGKDWNISIAQVVRTMISLSTTLSLLSPFLSHPDVKKALRASGVDPELIEWRGITLKRFEQYWNSDFHIVNKL